MKLAIDPGHGLANRRKGVYDPGAVAGGHEEATIALEWAMTLKHYCTEAGIECWLTRTSRDFAAPLSARTSRAKANGCTRLISLHCNAYSGEARGTETLYRAGSQGSEDWAALVQQAACGALAEIDEDWRDRGIKPDTSSQHSRGLTILRGGILACLLEIGFIDSAEDRTLLLSRDARIAVCSQIVAKLKELD